MSKSEPASHKKERSKSISWIISIFITTIIVSGIISFASSEIMERSTMMVAFIILFVIVFVGIVFDIIGVAVTSADEKPFHSMAARKVPGSQEAIGLLRKAERVSSICNDVIGDICGVVSGSASASIATQIVANFSGDVDEIVLLLMSALVAGITVGGKAIGKGFAIGSCTKIVSFVGKTIWTVGHIPDLLSRKKNNSYEKRKGFVGNCRAFSFLKWRSGSPNIRISNTLCSFPPFTRLVLNRYLYYRYFPTFIQVTFYLIRHTYFV